MNLSRRELIALAGGLTISGAAAAAVLNGRSPRRTTTAAGPATSGAPATTSSSASSASTIAGAPTSSSSSSPAATSASAGHVLVVVQLGGGNDGLNTLVPLTGRYHDLRPTLGLNDADLLAFPGTTAYGLHPALKPLLPLLSADHVAAIEAIGYQHPNRSHFASLDDWWSGTPGQASATGWLGRWLDATVGDDDDPLRAVALGAGVPALTGVSSRPTVVLSPQAFALRSPRRVDANALVTAWSGASSGASGGSSSAVDAYRSAVRSAAQAVEVFAKLESDQKAAAAQAADAAAAGASDDPAGGEITSALGTAAQLVMKHQATRVIHIAAGGFDTHANQAKAQETLLGDLATGLAHFFGTLAKTGDDQRVLVMTVSEFGRRAAQNGSGGTDHGKANVQFLLGPSVKGGVVGDADLARLDDGDLAPQIDVRSLYTSGLAWLGGPVDEVLGGHFDPLGVVTG